jgi:hypothetical protein
LIDWEVIENEQENIFGSREQIPGKQGWAMTLNDQRESHQEGNARPESHY